LDQPQGIVPDGDDVPQQHDLGLVGDAGQDGRFDVDRAAHAEGGAVMLVEHQHVEPDLFRVQLLVEVAVVEVRADLPVLDVVAKAQVGDWFAGVAKVARRWILVWPLGEIANVHGLGPPEPFLSTTTPAPRRATDRWWHPPTKSVLNESRAGLNNT